MAKRKQPRTIARELALLSISQFKSKSTNLEDLDLDDLILAAVRTLTGEIKETLELASSEVRRGHDQLEEAERRASSMASARTMVGEAINLTKDAINRLGAVIDLPETIQLANKIEVRQYALEIIGTVYRRDREIKEYIEESLVDWQLHRLPKIDQDILRIAVAEMIFLELPDRVAINEAIEMAKNYSDQEAHRFLNGVLRRIHDRWVKLSTP